MTDRATETVNTGIIGAWCWSDAGTHDFFGQRLGDEEALTRPALGDRLEVSILRAEGCEATSPDGSVRVFAVGQTFDRKQAPTATAILNKYLEFPVASFAGGLVGAFAFLVVDRNRQRALLGGDALGLRPWFIRKRADSLAFSTTVRAFGGPNVEVNEEAVRQYLERDQLLGRTSWVSDTEPSPPGRVIELSLIRPLLEYHDHELKVPRLAPTMAAGIDRVAEALVEAVRDVSAANQNISVTVDGTVSSELLAAAVVQTCPHARAVTVASDPSARLLASRAVSGRFNLPNYRFDPRQPGWFASRVDANLRAEGLHLLTDPLEPFDTSSRQSLIVCSIPVDLLLGTDGLLGYADIRREQLLDAQRRVLTQQLAAQGDRLALPFLHPEVVDACLALETAYLWGGRAVKLTGQKLAGSGFGENRIVVDVTGAAIGAPRRQGPLYARAQDFHNWLRRDRGSRAALWQLLSSPSAKYPQYLSQRRVLADFGRFFRRGDPAARGPLLRAASLEIWLQQLHAEKQLEAVELGFGSELVEESATPVELVSDAEAGFLAPSASSVAAPVPPSLDSDVPPTVTSHPKVSVILPCFNVAPYLAECLDSLIGQTLDNLEILAVNDGSSDGTGDILSAYAARDSRIKITTIANQGVYTARSIALTRAQGEFISYVDSDDVVHSTMLEKLTTAAQTLGADVALCDVYQFDPRRVARTRDNTLQLPERVPFSLKTRPDIVRDGFITLWNRVYRRSFLDEHDIRFSVDHHISLDMLYLQQVVRHAQTMVRVPEPLYHYRFAAPDSLTSYKVRNERVRDHVAVTIELVSYWVREGLFEELAEYVLTKAVRNVLWNTHIDIDKLAVVHQELGAYFKTLEIPEEALAALKPRERDTLQALRHGTFRDFLKAVSSFRRRMILEKGGKLTPTEKLGVAANERWDQVRKGVQVRRDRNGQAEYELGGSMFRIIVKAPKLPRFSKSIAKVHALVGYDPCRRRIEAEVRALERARKPGAKHTVLHLSNSFSRPSETFTYDVITGLEESGELDNHVACFERELVLERPFPKVLTVHGESRVTLDQQDERCIAKLKRVIEVLKPDLIHAHFGFVGMPLLPALEAMGYSTPVVITMHGTDVNMWPKRYAWYADLLKAIDRYPRVTFTTHTKVYRDKLCELGVPAGMVHVIPNSFQSTFDMSEEKPSTFKETGVLRIVNVARMDIWKGHDHLIAGFADFLERIYPYAELTLVGYGPELGRLKGLARDLGIRDRVEFRGRVRHEHVATVLKHHDVYVQPSIRHAETLQEEGQPIAVLEAIACGLPVVVTNTGGMGETVCVDHHEGRAFIVPEQDPRAIADALQSVMHSLRSGANGEAYRQAIVAKHQRTLQVQATRDVYARVLGTQDTQAANFDDAAAGDLPLRSELRPTAKGLSSTCQPLRAPR